MEHGVKTIVDPACMDIGRDVTLAKRVVEETGIQLVMCTGVYGLALHVPAAALRQTATSTPSSTRSSTTSRWASRAPTSRPPSSSAPSTSRASPRTSSKVLRAVAQASKRTGRPIMAHSHPGTRARAGDHGVFDEEGIDPQQGADRAHRRHRRPRLHRGAAGARPLHRHGPLRPRHLPADRRSATRP